MKAIVDRKEFLEVISKVKRVVMPQATLPIITNVLIQAEGGKLKVIGTDLESFISGTCKAKVLKTGGICISPKSAEAFLKAVDAETVTIAVETKTTTVTTHQPDNYNPETQLYEKQPDIISKETSSSATLTAGNASASLEYFAAEDFPPVPECKGDKVKVIGLVDALKRVSYAMSKDNTRPVLSGVFLNPHDGKLELAASDGFRLAVTTIKGTIPRGIIVPARVIALLERVMPNTNSIRVETIVQHEGDSPGIANPSMVQFEGDGLILTARAVDGNFPDYRQLIPTGGTALRLQQSDLLRAFKIAGAIKPPNGIIRLSANGKGQLTVSCHHDEATTEAKIPAIGKKCRVALNIAYLTEMLQRVEGQVKMFIHKESDPIKVEHKGTTHLIMPMFVQW